MCLCVDACGSCIGELEPHISVLFFCSACCCCGSCCRIMSSVSHRPSSSRALYFVSATVQQQSQPVCVDHYLISLRVLTWHMRVCCVCYGRVSRYVRVCGFTCVLAPHISAFFFISFALLAAAAAVSFMSVSHRASSARYLYFVAATVQQQLHSKFVWTTSMPMLALHIYACVVCVL